MQRGEEIVWGFREEGRITLHLDLGIMSSEYN